MKEDKEWSLLSTNNRQTYAELQGGPISDQSTVSYTHLEIFMWILLAIVKLLMVVWNLHLKVWML